MLYWLFIGICNYWKNTLAEKQHDNIFFSLRSQRINNLASVVLWATVFFFISLERDEAHYSSCPAELCHLAQTAALNFTARQNLKQRFKSDEFYFSPLAFSPSASVLPSSSSSSSLSHPYTNSLPVKSDWIFPALMSVAASAVRPPQVSPSGRAQKSTPAFTEKNIKKKKKKKPSINWPREENEEP